MSVRLETETNINDCQLHNEVPTVEHQSRDMDHIPALMFNSRHFIVKLTVINPSLLCAATPGHCTLTFTQYYTFMTCIFDFYDFTPTIT